MNNEKYVLASTYARFSSILMKNNGYIMKQELNYTIRSE